MAQDPIIGTWVVTLFEGGRAKYKYRYSCSAPPKKGAAVARWSDYWDPGSKGTGTWARAGNQINFTWPGSSTTNEYLVIAPTTQSDKASGKAMTTYGTFSTVAERTDIVDPAQDIIQQWADNYGDYQSPHICPWAIPYMLFCAPRKVTYNTKNYGPPLNRVRGLAIHTTWSYRSADEKRMVESAINDWNPRMAGAHFFIGNSGTLVQIVPLNRVAYAQGGVNGADNFWVSVEIQTRNEPANNEQLFSARILFQWLVGKYGFSKAVATGYVGKHLYGGADDWQRKLAENAKRDYDPITPKISSTTTTDISKSIDSSGLSCHYWLNPVKPCPGVPLLWQLPDIAKGF
jgi:hypothetical protein